MFPTILLQIHRSKLFSTAPHRPHLKRVLQHSRAVGLTIALLGLLAFSHSLQAGENYSLDLTGNSRAPLPDWLDAFTQTGFSSGPGTIEIPLRAPENGTHLAVTVLFPDAAGETLAATWQATGDANGYVLSANLLEGLNGVRNQRTFLIERALVDAGGTLTLAYSNPSVAPTRVVLAWLDTEFLLTDDRESLPAVLSSSGQTISPASLTGTPISAEPDKVGRTVVDAVLADGPEPLDEAIQLDLTLDNAVQLARVAVSVIGLPLNASVSIYLNGTYAGESQMQMPGLADPGYEVTDGVPTYAGWRSAVLTLPGKLLRVGNNSLILVPSTTDPNLELTSPIYLRNARLQLIYSSSSPSP